MIDFISLFFFLDIDTVIINGTVPEVPSGRALWENITRELALINTEVASFGVRRTRDLHLRPHLCCFWTD